MVCSRCAGTGHTHRECASVEVRCAACNRHHSTFDNNCRLYRAACEQHRSHRLRVTDSTYCRLTSARDARLSSVYSTTKHYRTLEPYCWRTEDQVIVAPQHHAYWTPFIPTAHNPHGQRPFRSMIWAHRRLAVKQIPTPLHDITALLVKLGDRRILVFSVYVPHRRKDVEDPLPRRPRMIRDILAQVEREEAPHLVETLWPAISIDMTSCGEETRWRAHAVKAKERRLSR